MIERTRQVAGCSNGPCVKLFETTDPEWLEVQGKLPSAMGAAEVDGIPADEGRLFVLRSVMDEYADGR